MKKQNIILRFLLHPIWHYSPTKIAALVRADWLDELVPAEQVKQLRKDFAEVQAGKVTIHDLAVRNGTICAEMGTELVQVMAESFHKTLAQHDAKNYLEFGFKTKGQSEESIIVTVQRVSGKTPHQMRLATEAELKAVREMVSRFLVAHRDVARSWLDSFVDCGAVEVDYTYHPNYPYIKPKGGVS